MTASILVTRKWPAEVESLLAERFGAALNDADMAMTAAALDILKKG